MRATLLEAVRGEEADDLARSQLRRYSYQEPIRGQEYMAVKVRLEVLEYEDPNVQILYPHWHLTLRHSESGGDIWSVDPLVKWQEGYVPLRGEGWVFFLVKEDSHPHLYVHPYLLITEQLGIRTGGVFFSLP